MSPELDAAMLAADELLLVPDHLMLRDGPATGHAVLVAGGLFRDVGPAGVLAARHPHLTPLALPGKLLMPGMIDAHHHLTQSFGKSLAYGEPSEIFRRVWVPLESSLDDEFVYLASKLAALESLRGGFTTVCDAGTRAPGDIGAIAAAVQEAGLRCVLGLICNDGGNDSSAGERREILARAGHFLGRWPREGLVHPSLAVSVPEAASDEMLAGVSSLCAEARAIFQTHVNEHLASVERSVVQRGCRPLELLARLDALGPQVLIAHGTLVTPSELMQLRDTDTAVSYNPVASQWKGNAVAPANLMATMGIRFGLGTDATRSDAFRLMDAAEAAQKLAFGLAVGDASSGGGWTWFDHATHEGARAVGLDHLTGEIAAGKHADFLIVDVDTPEMCTSVDLTWDLVRLGNRDQISAVFVAGRLRLWEGWPPDWDARALQRRLAEIAHAAMDRAPILRLHPTAAEHRRLCRARAEGGLGLGPQ
ncbi:amidohydrolase family protein [Variovorax guangxiensis]|uniref:Cytosine/adenosine deaminase-related metal-dependent hydrolase n=1 Tax=Variovorax guangxiensis TaxID=1775474 RepID=A0A840FDY8_9BURK|nr:amidohydrolase family protein [Variovorax guangxiensis]MBB4219302.1 cytosine/adenosine deaminase-related metal-dependent hydrolase [Variovorax guangxiensis]